MKQFLRDYFSFNRRERNGLVVLLALLAVLVGFMEYLHDTEDAVPLSEVFREETVADSAVAKERERKSELAEPVYESPAKPAPHPDYFEFNPNRTPESAWMRLGLSAKQAGIIRNYLSKGGKFRKKEDLRKIYGLHPDQEAELEPWVRIPEDSLEKEKQKDKKSKIDSVSHRLPYVSHKLPAGEQLELNTADSLGLLRLPCIGPVFAKRILGYRARLGGFVSAGQLMEVFGMDEERFSCMLAQIRIAPDSVKKLNINSATMDELRRHPYIPWKLANLIVNYRKQHGAYRSLDELKKLELMNEALFLKLEPYLSLNE